jgi:hypothetical protein
MNVTSKALVTLVLALIPYGCSTKMTPAEYLRYFEKNRNNFTSTITRNGITATVTYMPAEYYIAREMVEDTSIKIDSLRLKYSQTIFFVLTISKTGGGGSTGLQFPENRIVTFGDVDANAVGNRNGIFMLSKNDTVMVSICNYELNCGIGNGDIFLLAFSRKQLEKELGSYRLIIRNLLVEIGTLEIKMSGIVKKSKKLKG